MGKLAKERVAAEIAGVSPRLLQKLRRHGGGPPFIRITPKAIRYDLDALRRWLEERTRTGATDRAEARS